MAETRVSIVGAAGYTGGEALRLLLGHPRVSIAQVTSESKRGQFVHYSLADDNLLGTLHNYLATFCPVGGPLKKESAALARAKKGARG